MSDLISCLNGLGHTAAYEAAELIDRLDRENGTLRERIKDLEGTLTNTRAERDAARGNWAFKRERVEELERELGEFRYAAGACAVALAEATAELDRLRAESVIEWEPGRSYTAAELLRRAIRGLRVRKDSDLWPAVRNMCGVGSTVAHFLCRWAGRDPDTGADLDAARAAREG